MNYSTGKLSFIFALAVLLSFVGAWWVARRYRAAMHRLMSAPRPTPYVVRPPRGSRKLRAAVRFLVSAPRPPPGGDRPPRESGKPRAARRFLESAPRPTSTSPAPRGGLSKVAEPHFLKSSPVPAPHDAFPPLSTLPEPAPVTARDNRRAGYRLALLLVALSALISLSSAALQLHVVMTEKFSLHKLAVLGFVQLWPVIPSLGLLWRWSRWRVSGALVLWFVVCFGVLVWRVDGAEPLKLLSYLAFEIGPPMLLAGAVCLGGATRAIAPWLLLPMIGLVWASQTGLDLIALMIPRPPGWFLTLTGWLGAHTVMALFVLLPWLLAWWPLKWLGRLLARAYARKSLSELMVLFTTVWCISQTAKALMAASDMGLGGAVLLLPLAWVPVAMALTRRVANPHGRPPTLLVLRVFQHDERTQALFDHVIERWRLTGNTVLIAGTDLLERTLDAGDIFTFIDGELASRFIHSPADVGARLAAFDLAPDAEGRFRINECYCHDTTWQQALAVLVQRSDVVLMDLRSFKVRNEGCRHELGVLARAARIQRVVVLTDGDTDRAAARAATEGAPAGRFVWLDTSRIDRAKRCEVLESLFVTGAEIERQGRNAAAPTG